jgi:electron transport complex protein RnfE
MSDFSDGLFRENPVFVTMIGLCPSIAVTSNLADALALSLILLTIITFVSVSVSLLRTVVPEQFHIVVSLAVTGLFVSIAELVIRTQIPMMGERLGIYLPLLVVNGVILTNLNAVSWHSTPGRSVLDALSRGLGFLLGLCLIAVVREAIGQGTLTFWPWAGARSTIAVPFLQSHPLSLFHTSVGAFIVVAYVKALSVYRNNRRAEAAEQHEASSGGKQ